jgi:arylsulfatase A-like enzyme
MTYASLSRLLCWLGVLCVLGGSAAFGAPTTRPNILLLIADDQSFAHTSINGDPVVKTPAFDRIAREGANFSRAYCVAASCTPSRASLLTGRPVWQLEEGANLWSTLPAKFETYPERLEKAGYRVGFAGKGWGPGDFKPGGRTRNPAGPNFKNFEAFLATVEKDQPFCFWFGSRQPHRPYEAGVGVKVGLDPAKVRVPPSMPDVPEVRRDICDYLHEIEQFDADVARILSALEREKKLNDTLIVITSDNGMPFPRGKATLYDLGTHMPLAIRWPAGHIRSGRTIEAFVSFVDLAPTILQAAGVDVPKEIVGRSLLPALRSDENVTSDPSRDRVFLGNERHAYVRAGRVGYPRRAVRTADYLYIHNYEPDRWPAGDPPLFGDVDPAASMRGGSPSKEFILDHRDDAAYRKYFELTFAKQPGEELYDLKSDPGEQTNVADDPKYASVKKELRAALEKQLAETADPRAVGSGPARFDSYPYYGPDRKLPGERTTRPGPAPE